MVSPMESVEPGDSVSSCSKYCLYLACGCHIVISSYTMASYRHIKLHHGLIASYPHITYHVTSRCIVSSYRCHIIHYEARALTWHFLQVQKSSSLAACSQ